MGLAEKFVHVRELNIPDDSSPDGVAPAMWGPYIGGGKMHRFYCKDCNMYINANFPRWDRMLNRERDVKGVLQNYFKCPACIKSNFVEIDLNSNLEVETDE